MTKPKICFMFLTRDNLTRTDIWTKFFRDIDTTLYSIVCHPKDRSRVIQTLLLPNIIDASIDTNWGEFSLIDAEIELLRAGLRDDKNEMFVLLSENSCPLWSFHIIYTHLMNNRFSYIGVFDKQRIRKFAVYGNVVDSFIGHSQWIILNRQHTEFYVNHAQRHKTIYQNIPIPDEHYFGCIAKQEKLDNIVFKSKTFAYIKNRHAQRLKKLDKNIIIVLRKQNFLFVRKIDASTIVNVEYLIKL